jgi:hypothetical protein
MAIGAREEREVHALGEKASRRFRP